jgi:hypothetical protein
MNDNSSFLSLFENNVTFVENNDSTVLSWHHRGTLVMERYVFLVIFILGWINNSLSILVLQTKAYRGTSTGFLMTVLACADIGVVSTSAARIWIKGLLGYDVRLYSSVACQCHVFLTYLFIHSSAWSLTLITIERVVCVCNPLRVREIFSLRKTILAWNVIIVMLGGFDINFMWTTNVHYVNDSMICIATQTYVVNGFWEIWSFIDLNLSSVLPFAIILPCNVIILSYIHRRAAWRQNTSSTGSKISSTTVMLTVNSLAFVLFTAPAAIYLTIQSFVKVFVYYHARIFIESVCFAMFNFNSCFNFVLYSASSSKFRRALMSLLSKQAPPTNKKY